MTPQQKIKAIILTTIRSYDEGETPGVELTAENIEDEWDAADERDPDSLHETKCEMREGQVETDLQCEYSRHYESKSVAAKAPDGTWVGWTYWYGGGKHGEPEAIDWIEDAYNLECTEQKKLVIVREFKKAA